MWDHHVNAITVTMSLYDVVLRMEYYQLDDEGQMQVATKVGIVMSPQLAYQLATILADKLIQYELKYGGIPRPATLDKKEDAGE